MTLASDAKFASSHHAPSRLAGNVRHENLPFGFSFLASFASLASCLLLLPFNLQFLLTSTLIPQTASILKPFISAPRDAPISQQPKGGSVQQIWGSHKETPPAASQYSQSNTPANPHQHRPVPTDCSICIRPPLPPSITSCRSSCNHFANCGNLVVITQGPTASLPPAERYFLRPRRNRSGHPGSTHVFVGIAPRYYPSHCGL